MKQGPVINRIVMFLLLGAVMTYLGVSVWQNLTGRVTTVVSYAYTLDDVAEATGFLVRREYVLPARSTLVDILPAEGERVAVNEPVAYLYQDSAGLERRREIRRLDMELEQLAQTAASAGNLSDGARLTEEIMTELTGLRAAVTARDFTSLEEDTLKLKSLVYQRDYTYESGGDAAGLQALAASLTSQRNALIAAAGQDTAMVTADKSGIFSAVVDGYESILTPDTMADLNPSALDALAASPPEREGGVVGKLMTENRWYFVCTVTEDHAQRLTEGWQVKVRFSRDWAGEVSMRVERIGLPEDGRVSVIFSSTRYLSDTTLLRRQTVDIVYSSTTGIRVPKNALLQSEAGVWGVYAVVGAQAEFKPVTIVGDDVDYYLVQPLVGATDIDKDTAKKALRAGDEIILRADGLFDGKVVRS